jgi:hypothetical protein
VAVKFLSVLLATTLIAPAAPGDPGTAAIDFLEKVRQRKIRLEPGGDTAISAQTGEEKRRQIERRLDRMARDLGDDPLEIGPVTQDGNFAAVIIRKVGGFDPSRLQVFPLALVKKDTDWSVAPVPASFENSGAGYATGLRKRLETLENWMLREQVVDLEKLRAQSAARMRENIETRLSADRLKKLSAQEAGADFISACERRDLPSVLGLLGGLDSELPEDWPTRLKAAERALTAGPGAIRPWRLLISPEVLRVVVDADERNSSGFISIACLDPTCPDEESPEPRIHLLHLEMAKSGDGFWRVNPPRVFLLDDEEPADEAEDELDSDLTGQFAAKWSADFPPVPRPTAEMAQKALAEALRETNLTTALRLANLASAPETARESCLAAARLWWKIREPSALRHAMPLALKAEGNVAAGIFQIFSSRNPEQLDACPVYFEKSPSGWLWTPEPTADVVAGFKPWVDAEVQSWPDRWQDLLITGMPVIAKGEPPPAPAAEEARACVESWLDANRRGDVGTSLSFTARLDDPNSRVAVLRNTGYEILGIRQAARPPEITGVHPGKFFTAVGIRTLADGKPTHPLYPVISTASGPRILLEIDLFASGKRSREFLNADALKRLSRATSPAVSEDLKALLGRHQAKTESFSTAPTDVR